MSYSKFERLRQGLYNNILATWILGGLLAFVIPVVWFFWPRFPLLPLLALDFLAILAACVSYFFAYRPRQYIRLAANLQSLLILVLMTLGIHFSGGLASPLLWVYILSIVVEGSTLGGRRPLLVATAANFLLIGMVFLEWNGILSPVDYLGWAYSTDAWFVLSHLVSVLAANYLIALAVYFWTGTLFTQQEELRRMDRAKDHFLSVTSHELKTPMTPMKAEIDMLLQGGFGEVNEKQRESLKIVLRNLLRLQKMVLDVLEFSRIHSRRLQLTREPTPLKELLSEAYRMHELEAKEKGIEFSLDVSQDHVVYVDWDRMMEVLSNLLQNAFKFTDKGGKVKLFTETHPSEVVVCVQDTGIGMEDGEVKQLFTPFYQAKSTNSKNHKGTGLGLVICKGIVEAHKGRIWVESEPRKGSKVCFAMPRLEEDPEAV